MSRGRTAVTSDVNRQVQKILKISFKNSTKKTENTKFVLVMVFVVVVVFVIVVFVVVIFIMVTFVIVVFVVFILVMVVFVISPIPNFRNTVFNLKSPFLTV